MRWFLHESAEISAEWFARLILGKLRLIEAEALIGEIVA